MGLRAVRAGFITIVLCAGGLAPAAATASVLTSTATPSMAGMLTGISCPTSKDCVSTSATSTVTGGAVVGTTDGGHTWKPLTTPPDVGGLNGVACPTTQRCEVVGDGNGDAGAVYGSHDGGQTWRAQSAVLAGGVFAAVTCPAQLVCEAAGNSGAIFGTTDGGKTWTQQKTPATANLVQAVACPTTATCEAVGYGNGAGMALGTSDGGATWSAQSLPSSVQYLDGVACSTVTHCAAVGMNVINGGSQEVGVVVTTFDGGRTWTQQSIPAGYTNLDAVACPTVYICEAGGLGPTAMLGSFDGGVMWAAQPLNGSMFIKAITCPHAWRCEAVGQDSNDHDVAFGTVNGGRSWARQVIPAS